MPGRIIEAELRITGSDKSGAAFAGVIKHAQELQRALGGLKGMKIDDPGFAKANADIKQRTQLLSVERRGVDELRRSMALLNGEYSRRSSLFDRGKHVYNSAAGQLGLMATGAMAGHTVRRGAIDAADFAHQRALLTAGGMKPGEVKEAVNAAWKASRSVPTVTAADSLKAIGELVTVFGGAHHAIEHLQPVLKATAAMRAVNPHIDAENESYNIARALELKGVSNDPEHFSKLLGRMVQAVNASRGKVTGSEFFEFTKYARAGATRLSDDFYSTVAPTLIQELGGHSAGTAFASLRQAVVGGKVKANAAKEFESLGLLDPESILRTKGGNVLGFRPGGMKGTNLFQTDPYAWVQQVLKPAMDKKGITAPDKVSELLAHLFGNRNAEAFANILYTQAQRIEKDRGLINQAPNADSIDQLKTNDPKTALRDLAAAVTDFLAAAGDPLMKPAIAGLNGLAGMMRSVGQSIAGLAPDHPLLAGAGSTAALGGAGYLGFKGLEAMWGGFGLKGSAVALNEAAAALTAAATRMGSVPSVAQSPIPVPAISPWATAIPGGMIAVQLYELQQNAALKAALMPTASWAEWRHRISGGPDDRDWARDPKMGSYTLSDIGTRLNGGNIKAELQGTVQTEVTVKIEPSPDFITRAVSSVKSFFGPNVNGVPATGTSGSTGRSMPEAGPMP